MSEIAPRVRRSLADLTLIVVGVLLALAADEWLEGRNEALDEDQVVSSILRDVTAELEWLEARRVDTATVPADLAEVLTALESPQPPEDQVRFVWLLGRLAFFYGFPQQKSSYEDLIGSGRLGVITDEGLRTRVIDYYTWADHFVPRDNERGTRIAAYLSAVHALIPPRIWVVVAGSAGTVPWENELSMMRLRSALPETDVGLDWSQIRASQELLSGINSVAQERAHQRLTWYIIASRAGALRDALRDYRGAT